MVVNWSLNIGELQKLNLFTYSLWYFQKSCRHIIRKKGNLPLFSHDPSTGMLHVLVRYDPQKITVAENETKYVCVSIVFLAGLDEFIETTVLCHRNDGTDSAGGHRQKKDHDIFANYLPTVCSNLVSYVAAHVLTWKPDSGRVELIISIKTINAEWSDNIYGSERKKL